LFGKLTKGGTVHVGVKDGALHLTYEEPQKPRLTGQKPPLLTAE
jgi:ATP-dependent Clp protease ATP-binding subunit ClpA